MVAIPSAIIFVNNDLSDSAQKHLVRQLHISEIQDGYTFDSNVAADPTYPDKIRQLDRRLMVVRTFADRATSTTWPIADVVIFVKLGLAAVEKNKFGPPALTLPVLKLYWGALGLY